MKFLLITFFSILLCVTALHADTQLPALSNDDVLGTVGYYRWRYNDFMSRHQHLAEPDPDRIPDYYLDYGEKYIKRFSNVLYPKLSENGKNWLVAARLNLQLAIENRCKANRAEFARLEENPVKFRKFAFDTHPGAYLDAGLENLPLSDLIKIGLTPDFKDLISKDGVSQIFAISRKLGKGYLKKVFAVIKNAYKLARNEIRNGNPEDALAAVNYLETLSYKDRVIIGILTGNYRKMLQDCKFMSSHSIDSTAYTDLIERLEYLRSLNK